MEEAEAEKPRDEAARGEGEEEDENIIPSRTKEGIARREREKPELTVAVTEALEFFKMQPTDWQVHRPLRGLAWRDAARVGTLLKAAALWLPGEPGHVGLRCVRLRTNLIGRRGVPLLLEGLDPVYATRGPGSATLRAGKGCEIPNFKGSYLGRFPLVLAEFWTSDHLSERSRP